MTDEIDSLRTGQAGFQSYATTLGDASVGLPTARAEMMKGNSPNVPMPVLIDKFFQTIYKDGKLPTNFDDFYSAYDQFMKANGATGTPSRTQLLLAFTQDYAARLSVSADQGWADLTPPVDLASAEGVENCENQFKGWFGQFLTNYPEPSDAEGLNTARFFNAAGAELSPSTTTSIDSREIGSTSLHKIFHETYPGASNAKFQEFLLSFYQKQVSDNGYFIPSQMVSDWKAFLANPPPTLSLVETVPVDPSSAQKTRCLNEILRLLTTLLGTMQAVAAAQSKGLLNSTDLQNAYTQRLAELHVFLKGDKTVLGQDTPECEKIRANLNEQLNSTLRVLNENKRQMEQDKAKRIMSSTTQTSDAVTQLANMFTSIIQELTNLLSVVLSQR